MKHKVLITYSPSTSLKTSSSAPTSKLAAESLICPVGSRVGRFSKSQSYHQGVTGSSVTRVQTQRNTHSTIPSTKQAGVWTSSPEILDSLPGMYFSHITLLKHVHRHSYRKICIFNSLLKVSSRKCIHRILLEAPWIKDFFPSLLYHL